MKKSFTLLALGATISLAAFAQAPETGRRVATIDELRACMDGNDALRLRKAALEERSGKLAEEARGIRSEVDELNDEANRARLDPTFSGARRERFERRQQAVNARSQALQQSSAAFEAERDAFNRDNAAMSARCGGIAFRNDDVETVRKEREAAGKK